MAKKRRYDPIMTKKRQKEIIEEMGAALFKKVAESPLTIEEIAERVPMSEGYLKQLKTGERRLNIYYLYSIAKALDKFPSELLPSDWQKPTQTADINEPILIECILAILSGHNKANRSTEERLSYAIDLYKMRLGENKQIPLGIKNNNKKHIDN